MNKYQEEYQHQRLYKKPEYGITTPTENDQ